MGAPDKPADDVTRWVGATVGGKYRIERLLGRGGMGAVFAAENLAIGKRVALKFLSAEAASNQEAARRFQREAKAASLIESEHIVQVFDAGTSDDGLPFLVMEHLHGEDLRTRLTRERELSVDAALTIATQVLRALVRAHAAGIVHRDLKPDNVFLCARDDGSVLVKLVDFGISKLERGTLAERLTRRGSVLGSAYYMAPEQAQASDDVDLRADLYGVGAMLFEMLSGRPPHLGPTLESVLVAICTQPAPKVSSFRPDAPAELGAAIARALERDPDARFPSAQEFLVALGAVPRADLGPALRRRPNRTLVLGVVATLVGFTVTAAWLAARRRELRPAPPPPVEAAPVAATGPRPPVVTPVLTPPSAALAAPPPSAAKDAPSPAPSVADTQRHAPMAPARVRAAPPHSPAEARRPAPPPPPAAGVATSLQLSTRGP